MDKSKYSLVVRALDFNKRSKSRNKFVDKESFLNVIQSDSFKEALANGFLMGELTHQGRMDNQYSNIPYEDSVVLSPYLCNVLRAVEVDGDKVYMGIDLLDTDAANKVKDLIRNKVNISVSISTIAKQDSSKFYITDIKGIDFTTKPDLDAEIIAANFSECSDENGVTEILGSESELELNDDINFSLRDYIREMNRPPYIVLRKRITEVIRYCRFRKVATLEKDAKHLRAYIDGFVYQYIMDMLNSNDNTQMNIVLGLRLNTYLNDRAPAVRLQQTFRRLKQAMKQTGVIPRELQKKLNKDFHAVMAQIYDYINTKSKKAGKILK